MKLEHTRRLLCQLALLSCLIILFCSAQETVITNDVCENAIALTTKPLEEKIFIGSTIDASPLERPNICGVNFITSPGVWFVYENTDTDIENSGDTVVVTVSTCTDFTDFDTALTVYSGPDCNSLTCLNGLDDDYECSTGSDIHSTIAFHAERYADTNTRYFILVHGSDANHTGNFGLQINTYTSAPAPSPTGASPASSFYPLPTQFNAFIWTMISTFTVAIIHSII